MLDPKQVDKLDQEEKIELIELRGLVGLIELQELEGKIEVKLLKEEQLRQGLQKLIKLQI